MKERSSPEEKLLRLIRDPKKQAASVKHPASAPAKASTLPIQESAPSVSGYSLIIRVRNFSVALFVITSLLFIFTLIRPLLGLKTTRSSDIIRSDLKETLAKQKSERQPLIFYESAVGSRQIFGSVSSGQTSQPTQAGVNTDIVKDITLVGIITGENPQAVIEDKKSNKTFYVTKGQFIGELQVSDIQEGKIVIEYQGQKFELYL